MVIKRTITKTLREKRVKVFCSPVAVGAVGIREALARKAKADYKQKNHCLSETDFQILV